MSVMHLTELKALRIQQRREIAEWFGFETRNKYEIQNEHGDIVAFAAEQNKGIWSLIARQYLGHWRSFDVLYFSPDRQPVLRAHHPFRIFFQRLEIFEGERRLGVLQQRFAFFSKRFDVQSAAGIVTMQVSSPFWRLWTFPFQKAGRKVASVSKKWSGVFTEWLTDRDSFVVEFSDSTLNDDERKLILGAALFIDLEYFERKA